MNILLENVVWIGFAGWVLTVFGVFGFFWWISK